VRIGILGGSFDPPHVGHLLAAVDAFDALALDRLHFVPTAVQPLKAGRAMATAEQRLEMVRRLCQGDPRFVADDVEVRRAGVSYSVDTLADFARRFPGAERYFIVGADVLASLHQWREPEQVLRLARLVVLRRGDEAADVSGVPGPVQVLESRRIDVSSTEVRHRIMAGRSIRGFVPDAVADYVAAGRLYL
jgi:nicotinate-nucleotide adenylyltransferase